MKMSIINKKEKEMRKEVNVIQEHRDCLRPIPPHNRKRAAQVEFNESDWIILKNVFGNEDTALAAVEIINSAPLEIQILATQLMNILEKEVN